MTCSRNRSVQGSDSEVTRCWFAVEPIGWCLSGDVRVLCVLVIFGKTRRNANSLREILAVVVTRHLIVMTIFDKNDKSARIWINNTDMTARNIGQMSTSAAMSGMCLLCKISLSNWILFWYDLFLYISDRIYIDFFYSRYAKFAKWKRLFLRNRKQ